MALINVNTDDGDSKGDHLKVCGEYPTDLGECPKGPPESKLTRKQKRNRNRNKGKESRHLQDLKNHADLSKFSVHRLRYNQPMRLVQTNEIITKSKRIGGIVRFTKFCDLSPHLRDQFEALSQHLVEQSQYLWPNANNGNKLGGTMFNAGWRKAYTHNEILKISAAVPKIAGHEERYLELQDEMKPMEAFLSTRFAHLSQLLYDTLRIQHKDLQLPSISSSSFSELNDFSFASHLSFTLNNFHNKPHCNNDSSTYSFGLWLPIDSRDGRLVMEDFHVQGGNFVFPDNNFGMKFEGFDGIVEMVWKADKFSHQTEPSTSDSYHSRLGLSCEIPSTSLQTIVRLQQKHYEKNPEAFFRDTNHIIHSCQTWKENQLNKAPKKKQKVHTEK
ncbi:hypothetical protein PGT21_029839 [Puccinia graminis f. sp. tritici]|uniref:Tet-like 2OG-Fe(II) oxygenase domain-containing protein n=1 Tax=Puccinia graminis f. sp. tritici TaxID=56615 RepID=A0A5B0PAU8_PUCGR|nr:hypothetical protein PGT21_029839 [Puccinia graminis f. sp. tritici]KAA1116863.1 hypothetical protein PGTUg99_027351 [Puccinia graminis f. sp. tritici]